MRKRFFGLLLALMMLAGMVATPRLSSAAPKTPGEYVVRVKATDGNGITQPGIYTERGAGATSQPLLRLSVSV